MELLNLVIIVVLLALSALFSGLTLGLMSLDIYALHRKMRLGNLEAKKIYPVRKQGNLLLTTLLIGNVAVNAVMAVFLGSLTTGLIASFLATGLIVIFGEILPQAFFSRYALRFGSKMVVLVRLFIFILYPVAKPIAWALDKLLGRELPTSYSKGEFRLLLEQHRESKSDLSKHEITLMEKGLLFADRQVKDVMTPLQNVFFVENDAILDAQLLQRIRSQGHSRIPVLNKQHNKVMGLLYSKDLLSVNPTERRMVNRVMRRKVHYIKETDRLDKVLNLFKEKRLHLFIVKGNTSLLVGIITLEDVLEEIVGEIMDEYDWVMDMRKAHELHEKA